MVAFMFLISMLVLPSFSINSCVKIQCTTEELMSSSRACLYNDLANNNPTVKLWACNNTYICDITKTGVVQTFKQQR